MKTGNPLAPSALRRLQALRGMGMVDYMVALGIFTFATLGLIGVELSAMKIDQMTNSKSGACEMARLSFNDMNSDIRAAKIWGIANGTFGSITTIPQGTSQRGNAIQLCLTTATNQYIVYYFNTNSGTLFRYHSGDAGTTTVAQYLTNSMYFQSEDPFGNLQTNLTYKGVVHTVMQFYQYQYPMTVIGPGYEYVFYQLNFRTTPHVPDGP
jgi:Tfp pilus assembly protein PilW